MREKKVISMLVGVAFLVGGSGMVLGSGEQPAPPAQQQEAKEVKFDDFIGTVTKEADGSFTFHAGTGEKWKLVDMDGGTERLEKVLGSPKVYINGVLDKDKKVLSAKGIGWDKPVEEQTQATKTSQAQQEQEQQQKGKGKSSTVKK